MNTKNYPKEIRTIVDLEDILWDKQLYIGSEKVGYIESFLSKILKGIITKPYILIDKVKVKKVKELNKYNKDAIKYKFTDFIEDLQSKEGLVFDMKDIEQDIDNIISKLKIEKTEYTIIEQYDVSQAVEKIKNKL